MVNGDGCISEGSGDSSENFLTNFGDEYLDIIRNSQNFKLTQTSKLTIQHFDSVRDWLIRETIQPPNGESKLNYWISSKSAPEVIHAIHFQFPFAIHWRLLIHSTHQNIPNAYRIREAKSNTISSRIGAVKVALILKWFKVCSRSFHKWFMSQNQCRITRRIDAEPKVNHQLWLTRPWIVPVLPFSLQLAVKVLRKEEWFNVHSKLKIMFLQARQQIVRRLIKDGYRCHWLILTLACRGQTSLVDISTLPSPYLPATCLPTSRLCRALTLRRSQSA